MDTIPNASIVNTWDDFHQRWAGPHNFLLAGDCVKPLKWDFPPLDQVIAELRADEMARITSGTVGDKLDISDQRERFCAMSVEKAMDEPFSLAHFKLSRFDAPGKFLHGFGDKVLTGWQNTLTAVGYTFDRCYPIIFISGRNSATNYHMDFSHVLAWQIHGSKRFCGLKDPDRWAPRDMRVNYNPNDFAKPAELTDADAHCLTMPPGAMLWNVLLTPHWVSSADDQVAMSVNLSHGGLRLHGKLSPNEAELEVFRQTNLDGAPQKLQGRY
jgi:hypothetical protein